jgi:hypothetical protein
VFLEDCIRCGNQPGVDEHGYCADCHWAVEVEVELGLRRLGRYLARWARFADWCAAHDGG